MLEAIQTVLGFDFGLRVIGVAVGQTLTQSATALEVIKAQNGIPSWCNVERVVRQWNAQILVVGIPYHLDGSYQPMTDKSLYFARQLKKRYLLPVYGVNECLTSVEARRVVHRDSKNKKWARLDSVAAKIILESWLNRKVSCPI